MKLLKNFFVRKERKNSFLHHLAEMAYKNINFTPVFNFWWMLNVDFMSW